MLSSTANVAGHVYRLASDNLYVFSSADKKTFRWDQLDEMLNLGNLQISVNLFHTIDHVFDYSITCIKTLYLN